MRLTCPGCGAVGSLELFCSDVDARAFAASMGKVSPVLARPITEYLSLFRPAKRVLTLPRARKLLDELLPMIEAGSIRRHGRDWMVSIAAWQAALDQMVAGRDKLTLPLKTHGYLLEILAGDANRQEAQAENERERERQRRTGAGPQPTTAEGEPRWAVPVETPDERMIRMRREQDAADRARELRQGVAGALKR